MQLLPTHADYAGIVLFEIRVGHEVLRPAVGNGDQQRDQNEESTMYECSHHCTIKRQNTTDPSAISLSS